MTCHLLKGLHCADNVDLSVILLNKGRLADELCSAGLRVEVIDETQYSFFQLRTRIRRVLKVNSPQIIHSHRYKENILALSASRFLSYCKLVTTQHGLPETHKYKGSFAGRLKSRFNFFLLQYRFHKVVAVSSDIQNFFIDMLKFSSARVQVIHNGIEIPPSTPQMYKENLLLIGSSGRLFPVKDYLLMVKIAGYLNEVDNIEFVLAGDGPERAQLERLIEDLSLQGVFSLEGHLDSMDAFYQKLYIYLNTSVHEGIPMTILEAMAHGLPIIAPKVGGIPEIIEDGVEGFLIDSRDPQDYAEKCLLLCQDRELREKMSTAAREKVCSEFSREQMVEHYLECYRELVE